MQSNNSFNVSEITHFYKHTKPSTYIFEGHRHRGYEFGLVCDGEIEQTCDENIMRLSKGNFYIIPAYSFHRVRSISSSPVTLSIVHFQTFDNHFKSSHLAYELTAKTSPVFSLFSDDIQSSNPKNGPCSYVSDTAKKLFEVFLQYSLAFEIDQVFEDKNAILYHKAVKYMENNLNKNLTIDDIARECMICRTSLKNLFSRYTGMGCIEFFNNMKLDRAKKLISQGCTCAEVSDMLGFAYQSYFSLKFKKIYGVSPSQIATGKQPTVRHEQFEEN